MKYLLLTCVVAACLFLGEATPINIEHFSFDPINVTDIVNNKLSSVTADWQDTFMVSNSTALRLDPGTLVNVTITIDYVMATDLKYIYVRDCFFDITNKHIDCTFVFDSVGISSNEYVMDGLLIDTIPMTGRGPMSIQAEDLTINLVGDIEGLTLPIQFSTVKVDFEMWQWTVDFEGIMPGTDLGELFNSFFSMVGPELLDILEINLNDNPDFLAWLNNILAKIVPPF